MFRSSLRRLARPASAFNAATPILSQTKVTLRQISTRSSLSAVNSHSVSKKLNSGIRLYSTESTAAATDAAAPAASGEIDSFKDLERLNVHPSLIASITEGMGYDKMTPVQSMTINPALQGTDIVAQAKTGTGKTLAFLLPLLNRMIQEDPSLAKRRAAYNASSSDIRGIVLSPTRELAEQIAVEAQRLAKHTGIVVQIAVGGTSKRGMLRQVQRQGCHLLVATPGRLNDLLSDPEANIDAPNLAAFVLDEADRMLDTGFEKELNEIIRRLPSAGEKQRQTMLVSATIPDDVIRLARSMVRADDFKFVQTIGEDESLTHDKVPQHVVQVSSWTNVLPTLFELLDRESKTIEATPGARPLKAIIYFNTTALVQMAGEYAFVRRREGISQIGAFNIHSKLSQEQRTRSANLFRRAKSAVLISSDVTARGMDFPDVTHVIQVDTPRSREDYIHRLGRTGRQGKEGEGWLMLPPSSIRASRKMLAGLPIKPDLSLESAETEVNPENMTPYFDEQKRIVNSMPEEILRTAYTSLFGVSPDKDLLARDLHQWTTVGWGRPQPPGVSSKWANMMGLDQRYLNLDSRGRDSPRFRDGHDDGLRSASRGGGFGRSGGGFGRGRESRSSDPFERMGQSARRDDNRRGYRGGSSF